MRWFYPDYKINVVTVENINEYVSFPQHVIKKFNAGKISLTHLSDLLRLELLINYGGIWADSTVFCTGRENTYLHYPLFIFQNTMRLQPSHLGSNWFIVAERNNPILKTTRDLLYQYWSDHDDLERGSYIVFHCLFKLAAEKYWDDWQKIPVFSNVPPHILQREFFKTYSEERFAQIAAMSHFHKLTWKYPSEMLVPEKIYGTHAAHILSLF